MIRCQICCVDRDGCDCEEEYTRNEYCNEDTPESLTKEIKELHERIEYKKKLILKLYKAKNLPI